MENILVTGGAGYIGAQCSKELKKNGFLPVCFDNLSTGNLEHVKWGPFFKGDLQDRSSIKKAIEQYQPKAIMHFAANAIVCESVKNPKIYYENNVLATINLLDVMLESKIDKIIFSSSCATFGHPKFSPIEETHPQEPVSPYGKSKLMIETILRDYFEAYDLNSISLRYFNAAGADLDLEMGEKRENETHLIPLAIEAAMESKILNIYGSDFETDDGTAIRDFIHVDDLAVAHIKALKHLFNNNKVFISLNLGSDKGYSIYQIIEEIEKHTNKKIKVKLHAKRKAEPAILFANSKKAKQVLDWQAKSDLKTIITTALKWHLKKNTF